MQCRGAGRQAAAALSLLLLYEGRWPHNQVKGPETSGAPESDPVAADAGRRDPEHDFTG